MSLPPAEDAEAKHIAPRRTDADRPLRMTNPPETANELLVGIGRDKGCKRKLGSKAWALDYKPNMTFLFCCSTKILREESCQSRNSILNRFRDSIGSFP